MKPHIVLFAVALAASALVVTFVVKQTERPASASPAPQIDQAQLAKIKADLQSEFSAGLKQIADKLDSLPSAGDFAELKRRVNMRPAPTVAPVKQKAACWVCSDSGRTVTNRACPYCTSGRKLTIGTPPVGTPEALPPAGGALQFVNAILPRCGPNGCGVASQPANVGRGVPVVRQVRQWRPFRGRFGR